MNINNLDPAPNLAQKFHQTITKSIPTSPSQPQKATFISRVQRFENPSGFTPGPGAYDQKIIEKHTLDYRSQKGYERSSSVSKEFAWIYDRSRMSFALSTSQNKVGPGQYGQVLSPTEALRSGWAKCQRFNSVHKVQPLLGPGSYDAKPQAKQTNVSLSVFKSKSPKSFFQQIIAKRTKQAKIQYKNPQQAQQDQQVTKFDQTSYPIRQKIDKPSSMFLSKCQRPQIINQQISQSIGPGSYNPSEQQNLNSTKTKSLISAMHYNINPLKVKKQISLSSKVSNPGPGAYTPSNQNPQQVVNRQPLGIIFKEERFKNHSPLKNQAPGPGQYMQNRFTMVKQQDIRLKNKGSFIKKAQKPHQFGMAARTTLRNRNQIPFGQYDIKNYDIQYKVMKQQQHYEKLKLMEVTLPAFNSKPRH